MKNILIIGGYGNAGREIARLLLPSHSDISITIAGRNESRAVQCAETFRTAFPGRSVQATALDIRDTVRLLDLVAESDFVVNASGTPQYMQSFIEVLLKTGKDALDTQLATGVKHQVLQEFEGQIRDSGICYITDAGFHPGVPAALARYAALKMGRIEKANIYSAMKIDWKRIQLSEATWEEFLGEFADYRTDRYLNGQWESTGSTQYFPYDFGPPFGKLYCMPMHLPEMEGLPNVLPGLRETGFFVSGFNPVTDYLVLPVVMLILKYLPKGYWKHATRLFRWGINLTKPPYGIMLAADCAGYEGSTKRKGTLTLFHEDAYVMTAAPVVACLGQYFEAESKRPGLWLQADFVEPLDFIHRLKSLGIKVEEKIE